MVILLIVLLVIAFLLFTPVYAKVYYENDLCVSIKILFINIKLYPRNKKNKKKGKKNLKKVNNKKGKAKGKTPAERKDKKEGILKLSGGINELVRIAKDIALRAVKAFTISKFYVHIVVASDDPCDTALQFGAINAAVYSAYSYLDSIIKIKNNQIKIDANYDLDEYKVKIDIRAKTFAARLIWGLLLIIKDVIILKTEDSKGDVN